jgi:uncharacterized membrane protein YccC
VCAENYFESRNTWYFFWSSLLLFFLLQIPSRHYPQFHPDLVDGIRGLLLGLALATFVRVAWKKRRRPTS